MSSEPVLYAIRNTQVTYERLDDEVIAIDLERGSYFAMVGPAADIWSSIVAGADTAEAGRALAERYGTAVDTVRADVDSFVARLVDERLITPVTRDVPRPGPGTDAVPPTAGTAVTWTTPELERYDDMADLVLLDPIHEVDEGGWPKLRSEP